MLENCFQISINAPENVDTVVVRKSICKDHILRGIEVPVILDGQAIRIHVMMQRFHGVSVKKRL